MTTIFTKLLIISITFYLFYAISIFVENNRQNYTTTKLTAFLSIAVIAVYTIAFSYIYLTSF